MDSNFIQMFVNWIAMVNSLFRKNNILYYHVKMYVYDYQIEISVNMEEITV